LLPSAASTSARVNFDVMCTLLRVGAAETGYTMFKASRNRAATASSPVSVQCWRHGSRQVPQITNP
jgi:hypothetical protein